MFVRYKHAREVIFFMCMSGDLELGTSIGLWDQAWMITYMMARGVGGEKGSRILQYLRDLAYSLPIGMCTN